MRDAHQDAPPGPGSWAMLVRKVQAGVRVWARTWKRPITVGLYARLILLEPGFQLAFGLRLQEWLGAAPVGGRLLRRLMWLQLCSRFGSDIDPQAVIGGGTHFPHPYGIVIGGACTIGEDVMILQNVTLGRLRPGEPGGPSIGDRATLNVGAVVLGDITLGAGAMIGANAVVLNDVPPGWSAVGVPARNLPPRPTGEQIA